MTTLGEWTAGTRVNLERSLKIGDELGGHLVTGHVDATARIVAREDITAKDDPFGATARFLVEVPADTAAFIARKGSVALDGVSLTVNSIEGTHAFRAPHPAQPQRDDVRGTQSRRSVESRGRPHGPLRGKACRGSDGRELAETKAGR